MIGRFFIWVEDQYGHVVRAFTWTGRASDGIVRAKQEARSRGVYVADVWATPATANQEV